MTVSGKIDVTVDNYKCNYCGYEHYQLNQISGQEGTVRHICGECMVKAFDRGLGYEPIREPEVSEPNTAGPLADTATVEAQT